MTTKLTDHVNGSKAFALTHEGGGQPCFSRSGGLLAPPRSGLPRGASLDTTEQLNHAPDPAPFRDYAPGREWGPGASPPAPSMGGDKPRGGADPGAVDAARTTLQKRARRKAYGHLLALNLRRVAKAPEMARAYHRTATKCGAVLDQDGGTVRQYWCGARWCPCCNAIRTARAWQAYGPELDGWDPAQRWMVTLTVPNVTGDALRETVREMHHAFSVITRAVKRAHGDVRMIRTTECTYSEKRGDYHPHCHLVVHGEAVARDVVARWLARWPTASPQAQDVRQADRGATAELFKYATKLASDKRDDDGTRRVVPAWALDTMFAALRGLRLWQAVGIRAANGDATAQDDTAPVRADQGTPAVSRPAESIRWTWCQPLTDWIDDTTGECLTDYTPGRHARLLLDKLDALLHAPRGAPDLQQGALGEGGSYAGREGPAPRDGA